MPQASPYPYTTASRRSGLRRNGEEFPADAAVSRLHDSAGAWINTIILRDITEQQRREYEELFLAEVGTVLAESLEFGETLASVAQLALRNDADFCFIELVDDNGQHRAAKAIGSDPGKAAVYEALERLPIDPDRPHLCRAAVQSRQPQLLADMSGAAIEGMTQSAEHRRLLEAVAPASMMCVPLLAHGRLLGALLVASCRAGRRYGPADLRLAVEFG